MSDSIPFKLSTPTARQNALRAVSGAPEGWEVVVRPPTRNADQNALFHALLADIVRAMPVYAGERMGIDDWKAAMVHALDTHEGRQGKAIPGLEGGVVLLRRSTRAMSKRDLSELIEYAQAWMTKNGIAIRAPELSPEACR